MTVSHNSKTGKTRITLTWLETRQVRSGLGLQEIKTAVDECVAQTFDKTVESITQPTPKKTT